MKTRVGGRRRFGFFIIPLMLFASGCDRGSGPSNIGKMAPQFAVTDGVASAELSKLRGKVVILNFWATWCATCVEELPSLLELHRKMPDLAIVAISIDQDDVVYRDLLTRHHVDLVTVRDASQQVNATYGTVQIPESYIIDRNGILRRKLVSSQDWNNPELISFLKTM
jgi:cytochrome c biogenesis protein CcmG, thiol:disulfide interchange protein DsbE